MIIILLLGFAYALAIMDFKFTIPEYIPEPLEPSTHIYEELL